jgi:hypothetical protein
METFPISKVALAEKGGRAFGRVPKSNALVLLRKREAPRVAMRRMGREAFLRG